MEIPIAEKIDPRDQTPDEPDENSSAPPKHINTTRRINDRLCIAGEGPKPARIMFIAIGPTEEETMTNQVGIYGAQIRQKPRYLKGPAGAIFKDLLGFVGIKQNEYYYTSMCKWLLPRTNRLKPKREDIFWAQESLFNEIEEVKPEIIVCLGKPVFDLLNELKVKVPLADIKCAWFRSERFNCRLYAMDEVTKPAYKPEHVEKFRIDLTEVRKMLDKLDGTAPPEVVRHYRTIENSSQLAEMLEMFDANRITLHSVDCEWKGNNHVSGKLRSMQDCWADGHAAYIKFMNEKGEYCFDKHYDEVGAMMQPHYNKPVVKYVGHHIAADFPWMHTWLGLDYYDKAEFDTEFGLQTVDEFSDLGLERVAICKTDLGRYDLELLLWLKENRQEPDAGYAYVPDRIIIPYGCADVDTVYRAYPSILADLARQNLLEYYYGIFLPFVTNSFTNFAILGLPMNIPQMDELRDLFSFAKENMDIKLKENIVLEAEGLLFNNLAQLEPMEGILAYEEINGLIKEGRVGAAFSILKDFTGVEKLGRLQPFFDHRAESPAFNIRSPDQMRRWLFDVKGFVPVKSTNNKEKGMPSMPWHKVMELPTDRQREYTPSTDKQSLEIMGGGDPVVQELLELNAVGNLSKAFLKEPTLDEETGEVTKENGLHAWLCHDKRIHGQMSTTETGRPRAWKPNVLNWPSWVNKKISDGVGKLFKRLNDDGILPERWKRYLTEPIPSIRSCVDVSMMENLKGSLGWCLVESDYQTAEVRGLAYISGDEKMIKMFEEPDTQFALIAGGNPEEDYIRVSYAPDCGIKPEGQDKRVIMKKVEKRKVKDILEGVEIPAGKLPKQVAFEMIQALVVEGLAIPCDYDYYFNLEPVEESKLARDENGVYLSPRFDFHWNLAEMVNHKPRELMNKKAERGAAKIGNFSSAYGATGETLERKIESDTGIKPPEGTGQALLDAIAKRQPIATAYLEAVAELPKNPGWMRAASGRVRHFHLHPENFYGINARAQRGMASAMGREARNFPFQESVAATAAKAGNWLLEFGRRHGLQGTPMEILYDSVVTLCPLEEREIWVKAHELFMFRKNGWWYHKRVLNYPIDTEINLGWSVRPPKEKRKFLDNMSYAPVKEEHRHILAFLDSEIARYKADPRLGVHNTEDMVEALKDLAA